MIDRPVGARLLSVAGARPTRVVSGAELGAPFGKSADWIEQRTGIRELRRVVPGELDGLFAAAMRDALRVGAATPDLVLTTSCSIGPDEAAAAARAVCPAVPTAHLNIACSGFTYAVAAADGFVRRGSAEHVLVVGAEQMSRLVDPADLATSIVFADGVGAALIGPSDTPAIGPLACGSDGAQADLIACHAALLQMQGQAVFRWAVETVPTLAEQACARAGVTLADIDVFVPHQANLRIIDAAARRLGLADKVVADDVVLAGNTSAASVPLALAALLARGAAQAGQLALLVGFGAGLAYAAQVVEVPPGVGALVPA